MYVAFFVKLAVALIYLTEKVVSHCCVYRLFLLSQNAPSHPPPPSSATPQDLLLSQFSLFDNVEIANYKLLQCANE